jgi:hypothetical protein
MLTMLAGRESGPRLLIGTASRFRMVATAGSTLWAGQISRLSFQVRMPLRSPLSTGAHGPVASLGKGNSTMTDDGVLAWGQLHSADFSEKTLGFRIEGDMPRVSRGRYAIVDASRFRITVMLANAFTEQQKKEKAK